MQNEILLVAEAVSSEKGLPKESIFEAIEMALATATKKRYEESSNIEVEIDSVTGDYETFRLWTIVSDEDLEDKGIEINLSEAKAKDKDIEIGAVVKEKIESKEIPLTELAFNVTISKAPSEYVKTIPQHIRAAKQLENIREIKKGDILSSSNVRSVRPGNGLHTKHYWDILGKECNQDIEFGTPMKFEFISK